MYYTITYVSKAKELMSEQSLTELLKESKDWNEKHGITGMLLYIRRQLLNHAEGRFIQVLEGEEVDVKYIFEKIKNDSRHFNIIQLNELPITTLNFESWTMGFESLDERQYLEIPGSFDLNASFLSNEPITTFNPSLDLLKLYYSINVRLDKNKGR